jgi:sterol desaturase/sphingolipid hydroxylase (fatty acid hydroxylase superfamily)
MEFHTQIIDTIYENFFDPKKRVFVGYLFSAIIISILWLCIVKKNTLTQCFHKIFDKKIFLSKSAKADYFLFIINIIIMMFLSPILISQLAIAAIVFEYLHTQTFLMPINANLYYLWLIPYFFTISYFVLDDLTKFITHALMHKIPILWEIHKTHHSARSLTPITIFRTHPLEGVIFVVRSALTQGIVIALFYYVYGNNITFITILGANLLSFWFHLLGSNLRHSHIWINYWDWLEKIFISPAQHQIHHSIKKEHHDKNFGVTFAIWDYIFGTLCTSKDNHVSKFGITENEYKYEHNIFYLYVSPFIGIFKIIYNYILSRFRNTNKQTFIVNKGIK